MKGRYSSWLLSRWLNAIGRCDPPSYCNGYSNDQSLKSIDDVAIRVTQRKSPLDEAYVIDVAVRGEPVQTIVLNADQAEQIARLLNSAAGSIRELDRYHAEHDTPRVLPTISLLDREFYIDERLGQLRAVDNAYDFIELKPT